MSPDWAGASRTLTVALLVLSTVLLAVMLWRAPALGEVMLQGVPLFSQDKPLLWAQTPLGFCTDETIDSAGCTITCLAMVYDYYAPGYTDPGKLNDLLKRNGGYVERSCLVNWDVLRDDRGLINPPNMRFAVTAANTVQRWVNQVSLSADSNFQAAAPGIDAEIRNGDPVIARVVFMKDGAEKQHFVVIVGVNNADKHVIYDPAGGIERILESTAYRLSYLVFFDRRENGDGPSAGLVAWWRFDESSGTVAVDSSPNGNTGTIYGAQRVSGVAGSGLHFDGIDDYVEVPSSGSLNLGGAFTFATWILLESLAGHPEDVILNKEGDVVGQRIPYELAVLDTSSPSHSGYFGWHLSVPGVSTDAPNVGAGWHEGGGPVPIGRWAHLALVFDGHEIRTYVDGALQRTFSGSGSVIQNTRAVRIGARGAPGPAHDFFNGCIDEVKIYSRALTDAEIASLVGVSSASSAHSSPSVPVPVPVGTRDDNDVFTPQSAWRIILAGIAAVALVLVLISSLRAPR